METIHDRNRTLRETNHPNSKHKFGRPRKVFRYQLEHPSHMGKWQFGSLGDDDKPDLYSICKFNGCDAREYSWSFSELGEILKSI